MKAFLLAAGFGKRLLPLTKTTPKPLIEVDGVPLIVRHILRLKEVGVTEFIINTHWLAEELHQALGDGSSLGVRIQWSDEDHILETGGGIKKALPLLGNDPFILVSSDTWTDFDFNLLIDGFSSQKALARLVLVENPEHNFCGDFAMDNVKGCIRMPSTKEKTYTYSGIALLDPIWVDSWQYGSSAYPLREPLIRAIENDQISGVLHSGMWSDVGSPERLQKIRELFDSSSI